MAVIVEHGDYGGVTAAPIARKIFDAWLLGPQADGDGDAGDGNAGELGEAGA